MSALTGYHPPPTVEHMSEYERRAARKVGQRKPRPQDCPTCHGSEHVCATHTDLPWARMSTAPTACNCTGTGRRCPTCQEPTPLPPRQR